MPAPTQQVLQNFILNAMIAEGLILQEFDSLGNPVPVVPAQVTPANLKYITALSKGITDCWSFWQSTQVVSPSGVPTPMNVSSTPVLGLGLLP